MAGTVWSKWFWSDWDTDPALKLCSLAAQGLWMRCLCIAASHDPIGYVSVAGRPLNSDDLSQLIGRPEPEVSALLSELDRNGVFSRDARNRIYSRRMVRDAKRAATARKNGKKGGNPKLSKETLFSGWDKGVDKGTLKGGVKPQLPEAISYKKEEEELAAALPSLEVVGGKDYAFVGETIRLTKSDFQRWQKAYHAIPDLTAELMNIDLWLADHADQKKRWFNATSGMLNKNHQQFLRRAAKEKDDESFVI